MNNKILEEVDNYVIHLLAKEDKALERAKNSSDLVGIPQQCISPIQGKLLQTMMMACNAKRVLELGTFVGYSAIWMAKALPKNGKLISIDINEDVSKLAQTNIDSAELGDKVTLMVGSALDILPNFIVNKIEPFDFIFIDADKPPYKEYFRCALALARPGTIIVLDNVVRNGKILDPDTTDEAVKGVQKLNKYLSECKEATSIILQSEGIKDHDGMAIVVVNQD
jgi:predicted O-methyltransferase YrrM